MWIYVSMGFKQILRQQLYVIFKCPIVEAVGYFMIKTLLEEILCGFSLSLHLCTHVFSSYRPKTGGNEIALQQRRQYAAQLIRSGFMVACDLLPNRIYDNQIVPDKHFK
uniref:Uncharacterized protein n=1 Tax=Glossina pallidipes TaxID=7398 RepID=A0A1A9ZQZ9_GLOPL